MKNKVCIIAEAGVNHNGSLKTAFRLCDAAKRCGADIVKFQTFRTKDNVLKDCSMPEYQKSNCPGRKSHWQLVKDLELTYAEFKKIKSHCGRIGIEFLSAPSEAKSLDFLCSLGCRMIKISSGEITNVPLLRKIGRTGKKVILSTGVSNIKEVKDAVRELTKAGTRKADITVLHCTTDYPARIEDVNLLAMLTIKKECGVKVGYSDHTQGVEVPIAAAALGASVIEKHFTLDKRMSGPDHKASMEPAEFCAMVKSIRKMEKALGSGIKKPAAAELKNRRIIRKTIVALKYISKGEVFSEKNTGVKRPEVGMSSSKWDRVIGKRAPRDFAKDEAVKI